MYNIGSIIPYLLVSNKVIKGIFQAKSYSIEKELQKHLSENSSLINDDLIFIEQWSLEKMAKPSVRRKHDLVFVNVEQFPPIFWVVEVKKFPAFIDEPFYYLDDAEERVELWKKFGILNVEPFIIWPAPASLQNSMILQPYCGIMSFFKSNHKWEDLDWEITNLGKDRLWGKFEREELKEMTKNDLKKELEKRSLSTSGGMQVLITRIIEFQENLSEEEHALSAVDVVFIKVQNWCILNGISLIRIMEINGQISIIIVPPYFPDMIFKLMNISTSIGGEYYKLWDLEKNREIENPKSFEAFNQKIDQLIYEYAGKKLKGAIGLVIMQDIKPTDFSEYPKIRDRIIDRLIIYQSSWKHLHGK